MSVEVIQETEKFQTNEIATISIAHGVHDTYSAFLPTLLPLLIEKFSLTNTLAGMLSFVYQIPSILQPLIGHLADHSNLRYLIILMPSVTGAMMSLLGIAPNQGFLIFLLLMAGLSSASLHAVGPVFTSALAGTRIGRSTGFWMVGGELGRALGPIVIVTALGFMTIEQLPWLMLGGIFTSLFLFFKFRTFEAQAQKPVTKLNWAGATANMWPIMIPIALLLFTRSMMTAALTTFLPVYMTDAGSSLWLAGVSLSIMEVAGIIGAFLSGTLSDTLGRRKILLISAAITPICMFLFILSSNFWQIFLLILLGFFGISVTPVIMAVVLESFPERRALANGLYMFFFFVMNGLSLFLVGKLGDTIGLRNTYFISAALIPLGLPVIGFLPKSIKRRK